MISLPRLAHDKHRESTQKESSKAWQGAMQVPALRSAQRSLLRSPFCHRLLLAPPCSSVAAAAAAALPPLLLLPPPPQRPLLRKQSSNSIS